VADGPYNMNVHDIMDLSWEDLINIIDLNEEHPTETPLDLSDIFGEVEV
jgi:hypothetical protein